MTPKPRLATFVTALGVAAALGVWFVGWQRPQVGGTQQSSDGSTPAAFPAPAPPPEGATRTELEAIATSHAGAEQTQRRLAIVDGQRVELPGAEVVIEPTVEELARGGRRRHSDAHGILLLEAADGDDSWVLVSKEGFCTHVGRLSDLEARRSSDGHDIRTVVLQSPRHLAVRVVDAYSGAAVLDATVEAFAPFGAESEQLEGELSSRLRTALCPEAMARDGVTRLTLAPKVRYLLRAAAFGYLESKIELGPDGAEARWFKSRRFDSPDADSTSSRPDRDPPSGRFEPLDLPPLAPDGTLTLPIRPLLVGAFEWPRVVVDGVEQAHAAGFSITAMSPRTEESGCEELSEAILYFNLPGDFTESLTQKLEADIVGMRRLAWSVFVQTRPGAISVHEVRWFAHLADGTVEHQRIDLPLRRAASFTAGDVVRTGDLELGSALAELVVRLKGIDPGAVPTASARHLCEVVEAEQGGFPMDSVRHRRSMEAGAETGAEESVDEFLFLLRPGAYRIEASLRTNLFPTRDCVVEAGQRTIVDVQIPPSTLQSIVFEVIDAQGRKRRDYSGAVFAGCLRYFRQAAADPPLEFVVPPGRHLLWLGDATGCAGSGRFEFDVAAGALRQKVTIRLRDLASEE